jgi:hypothetical protein
LRFMEKTDITSRSLDNPQINSVQTSTETWKCATCGKSHVGVPMSFAAEFPDMYANMKREERDTRALIGSDQCVIDQQRFFLWGCLEVPMLGGYPIRKEFLSGSFRPIDILPALECGCLCR